MYPWLGRCGTAPHTLTLFKTNIADFPTLFKTEFRFLIPCLRHLTQFKTKIDKSIVLKQATVDNFPVGVRWISGLIWSALFQVEKLNILSKSRYNVDLI